MFIVFEVARGISYVERLVVHRGRSSAIIIVVCSVAVDKLLVQRERGCLAVWLAVWLLWFAPDFFFFPLTPD